MKTRIIKQKRRIHAMNLSWQIQRDWINNPSLHLGLYPG